MRRVTARMLHDLGVKNGPDLPVSFDPVQLAKASILQELERLFKDDHAQWLAALRRLKAKDTNQKFLSPVQFQAVQQLIDELEIRVFKAMHRPKIPPSEGAVVRRIKGQLRKEA